MKPFLGLFAHWDLLLRQNPPGFLRKHFSRKGDFEVFIPKKTHSRILSSLSVPERIIGGNAANAAVALSELGIPCVLSCPARAPALMQELSKHRIFLMSDGKECSPLKCSRPDEEQEHIVFEIESYRKIFNYDEVERNFLLDRDFWASINKANYLFLAGLHCVPEKHRNKVDEIADSLENRRFKVHMELGFGRGVAEYAIKKLLAKGCIDSLGMNETELDMLGIHKRSPKETVQDMLSFLNKSGLERIGLHARDYRITAFKGSLERNLKAAEFSVQVCTANALGGIKKNFKKAKSVSPSKVQPFKSKNFLIIPSRVVENPKIIVGMGDTAAVTDSFFALKS